MAGYRILNQQNSNFILTASLPDHSRKTRGQTKQRMATILSHNNKLTSGMCLFGVLTSVGPLHLVFSFIFNQAACLLLHPTKPYRGVNFSYQRFLSGAYIDATELFQSWVSEALQSRRYYMSYLARYLQLHDWDPVRDRFATTPPK